MVTEVNDTAEIRDASGTLIKTIQKPPKRPLNDFLDQELPASVKKVKRPRRGRTSTESSAVPVAPAAIPSNGPSSAQNVASNPLPVIKEEQESPETYQARPASVNVGVHEPGYSHQSINPSQSSTFQPSIGVQTSNRVPLASQMDTSNMVLESGRKPDLTTILNPNGVHNSNNFDCSTYDRFDNQNSFPDNRNALNPNRSRTEQRSDEPVKAEPMDNNYDYPQLGNLNFDSPDIENGDLSGLPYPGPNGGYGPIGMSNTGSYSMDSNNGLGNMPVGLNNVGSNSMSSNNNSQYFMPNPNQFNGTNNMQQQGTPNQFGTAVGMPPPQPALTNPSAAHMNFTDPGLQHDNTHHPNGYSYTYGDTDYVGPGVGYAPTNQPLPRGTLQSQAPANSGQGGAPVGHNWTEEEVKEEGEEGN